MRVSKAAATVLMIIGALMLGLVGPAKAVTIGAIPNFGNVPLGGSKTIDVKITLAEGDEVTSVVGGPAPAFKTDLGCIGAVGDADGTTCTIGFTFTPQQLGTVEGTLFIEFALGSGGTANVTAKPEGTGVKASNDLQVFIALQPKALPVKKPVTFTAYTKNNGPDAAIDDTLTFFMPSGATFQSITKPAAVDCITPDVGTAGNIVCTTDKIDSGQTVAISVTVQPTIKKNGVSIRFDAQSDPAKNIESQTANNSFIVVTSVK